MTRTEFDAKEFVGSLPRRPGVYRMYNADHDILYIGKAKNLRDRVGTYFAANNVNPKVQALVGLIAHIEVTVANSETEALLLEYNLIKAHKPRFNVVLRDDKSFPYIQVQDSHEFPRLAFYRGPRSAPGRYFGPFPGRKRCASCRSCFGFAIAGIVFSPTAAGRVCNIRSGDARLRVWDW
jgi:excinuclease ABC subunit C